MALSWFVRLLIVAVFALFVRLLLTGFRGTPARRTAGRTKESVPLVKDPVCGTYIEPSHALSMHDGATIQYFCSEACRTTFRKSA